MRPSERGDCLVLAPLDLSAVSVYPPLLHPVAADTLRPLPQADRVGTSQGRRATARLTCKESLPVQPNLREKPLYHQPWLRLAWFDLAKQYGLCDHFSRCVCTELLPCPLQMHLDGHGRHAERVGDRVVSAT